jgi:hypothetical protein
MRGWGNQACEKEYGVSINQFGEYPLLSEKRDHSLMVTKLSLPTINNKFRSAQA